MTNSIFNELAQEEIITWWSRERGRVRRECEDFVETTFVVCSDKIDGFDGLQLFTSRLPKQAIEAEITERLASFARASQERLKANCAQSFLLVGDVVVHDDLDRVDLAQLSAAGIAGAGALGIAVASSGIATTVTTSSILGIFATATVVTFSWPAFLALAGGVGVVALASGAGFTHAVNRRRQALKKAIHNRLTHLMVGSPESRAVSVFDSLAAQLDDVRRTRTEALVRNAG